MTHRQELIQIRAQLDKLISKMPLEESEVTQALDYACADNTDALKRLSACLRIIKGVSDDSPETKNPE